MSSFDHSTGVRSRSNSKGDGSKSRSKSPVTQAAPDSKTDATIFKQAWNLLHNVCDGLSQPVTLVRPNLSKIDVKKLDSIRNLLSGNPDSCGTTPLSDQIGPDNEVWLNPIPASSKDKKCSPRPPTRKNSSVNGRKSDTCTMPVPEKKSSNGINCILDLGDDLGSVDVRKGTHRTNQNESSAQEYQQLLDGVKPFYPFLTGEPVEKTRPKPSQQAAKFLDFNYARPASYMQGLRASNTTMVPQNHEQQQRMIHRTVSKDYLENINDQLSKINTERNKQRDCQLFQQSIPSPRFCPSNEPSQSSFGQNNNVNISLTLALGQVQQNGQITPSTEPIQVQCNSNGGEQLIPRSVIIDGRVQKEKVETSMQTDFDETIGELQNHNQNTNRPVVRLDRENFRRMSTLEQTSTFPSRIPSQAENWKTRRPTSKPASATVSDTGPSGWADFFDIPNVLSYTGESIKAILNIADAIVYNFIIPPDNNMFTQEEMNAGEDQIAISLMRLVGIPQQLRHQIYQEAFHQVQAIQDISSGSLDVLNCIIDWLTNGDTGGREELVNKARILATITSEVDPDSEVWSQFERDVSIFSMAVGDVVKEGIDQAAETTRRCSQTLLAKIAKSLSNTSLPARTSSQERSSEPNKPSGSLTKILVKLPAITEEPSDHSIDAEFEGQTGTTSSLATSSTSAGTRASTSTKDSGKDVSLSGTASKAPHSSASLNVHMGNSSGKDTPVRMTSSAAESSGARTPANDVPVSGISPEVTIGTSDTVAVIPQSSNRVVYPDLEGKSNVEEGNKDKRNQKVRSTHKKVDETTIERECRRFAKMTTESVHATPVDSNEEINLNHSVGYESSDEHIPAPPPRRKHDAFLEAQDPSMYEFGIAGALASAAQSISATFRTQAHSISSYLFNRTMSEHEPATTHSTGVTIVELETEPLEEPKTPSRKESLKTSTENPQVLKASSSQTLEPESRPQSSTVCKTQEPQPKAVLRLNSSEHSEVPDGMDTPVLPPLNSLTADSKPETQPILRLRSSDIVEAPAPAVKPKENQLPTKIKEAMTAATNLLFDNNNNTEIPLTKASSETPIQGPTVTIPPRRRHAGVQLHKKISGEHVAKSKAKNFFERLNEIEPPKSGVFIKGACNTPGKMEAAQIRFGVNQNQNQTVGVAAEPDTNSAPAVVCHPTPERPKESPVYLEEDYSEDDEPEEATGMQTPVKPSSANIAHSKLSSGDIPISEQASELTQLLERMKPYWPQRMVSHERPQPVPKNPRFIPNQSLPSIEEQEAEAEVMTMEENDDEDDAEDQDETRMQMNLSALEKIVKNLCGEVASGSGSGANTPQKPSVHNSPYGHGHGHSKNVHDCPSGICTPPKPSIVFAGSRSSIMDVDSGKGFVSSKIPRRNFSRTKGTAAPTKTQYLNPNNASTISIYPPKRYSGMHSSSVAISNPLSKSPLPILSNPRMSSQSQRLISQTRTGGRGGVGAGGSGRMSSKTPTIEVIDVVPLISSNTPRPQLACTGTSSGIPVRVAVSSSRSFIAPTVNKLSYSQILHQKKQYMTKTTTQAHPTYNLPMKANRVPDYRNNNYNNNNSRINAPAPKQGGQTKPQTRKSGTGPFLVLQEKKPRTVTQRTDDVDVPNINSYRDYHGSQNQQHQSGSGSSRSRPAGQYR